MADSPVSPPTVLWLPSDRAWLDPRLVASNLYTQITDVTIGATGITQLAGLNADRWSIGFARQTLTPGPITVGPWSDVNVVPGIALPAETLLWYSQLQYGPVIGGEWFAGGTMGELVRVLEVIRIT